MTWHLAPLAAYDCETTGTDPETARIVTATLVRIHGNVTETREWLINPGIPIPAEATTIHGITDDHARKHGEQPAVAAAQILAELDECWTEQRPVIIFNASYDLTVLDRELRRHCGVQLPTPGVIIDPYVIDKELDRWRKGSRTLTASCAHYGVKQEGAHTSEGDALAAARIAWRQAKKWPERLNRLEDLNELQATWRRVWAEEFEEYLTKQGTPEPIDPHWPVRPYQAVS